METTVRSLQNQVNSLSKQFRCTKKIYYSTSPLSGDAGCFVFGIDNSSGDLYYADDNNQWQLFVVGGANFDAIVDFSVNANPNTVGTTFAPNTPQLDTVLYVSTIDASQWTWNGSNYVIYNYGNNSWNRTGNAATNPATNYVGTTDAQDLVFRTNSIERARFINSIGNLSTSFDAIINGLTVGRGLNNVATNTVLGSSVLLSNTTGSNNTAIGFQASLSNSTGVDNTSLGFSALRGNLLSRNTAIGKGAMNTASANDSVAVGYHALFQGSGNNNTAIGSEVLITNTTGNNSVAIGYKASRANTTGSSNVAIGSEAMSAAQTAFANIAIGGYSMANGTDRGSRNIAIGYQSMIISSTGQNNVGVGSSALQQIGTGSYNTALGGSSMVFQTNSTNNTAIGYQSLYSGSGNYNIAVGTNALTSSSYAGQYNIGLGVGAGGASVTTGSYNTFIGNNSGGGITTGSYNTIIGSGIALLSTTLSNNIILADGQGNIRQQFASTGALKLGAYGSGTFTGTPTRTLQVDASGNVIEQALGATGSFTSQDGKTITVVNGLITTII